MANVFDYYDKSAYLAHYGILGQKWGIRRYQNYDGSYTREGLRRYNRSLGEYQKAKDTHTIAKKMYRDTKKNGYTEINGQRVAVDKTVTKQTKAALKESERKLNRDYKQLRKDKAGDIGKKLYRSGQTITGNSERLAMAGYIAAGTTVVARYLTSIGRVNDAKYATYIGIGMEVGNGILAGVNEVKAHYLRAYYGHSRPKD